MHMEHAYDFYKPDLSSEYPVVDGKLSIQCYLSALDKCYQQYADKASVKDGHIFSLEAARFFIFHSPFTKLVAKSLARLKLNDLLRTASPDTSEKGPFAGLEALTGRSLESTLGDRDVEKLLLKSSGSEFREKTQPSVLLGTEVGNMYTASLYGGLASLLVRYIHVCMLYTFYEITLFYSKSPKELLGKRIVLFSYGSGLASCMYSIRVSTDSTCEPSLSSVVATINDIPDRLASRKFMPPGEFEQIMKLREETHHKAPYTPRGDIADLFPGTFYITSVDEKHRRSYSRVAPSAGEKTTESSLKSPLSQTLTNGVH